jgi:hypothetical protein
MGIEDAINEALNECKPATDAEIEVLKVADEIQNNAKNIDAIVVAYSVNGGEKSEISAFGNPMTCAGLAMLLDTWASERVYPDEG